MNLHYVNQFQAYFQPVTLNEQVGNVGDSKRSLVHFHFE